VLETTPAVAVPRCPACRASYDEVPVAGWELRGDTATATNVACEVAVLGQVAYGCRFSARGEICGECAPKEPPPPVPRCSLCQVASKVSCCHECVVRLGVAPDVIIDNVCECGNAWENCSCPPAVFGQPFGTVF
jgi:hypothetical protein